ncbi:glycosyltransferase family 1 protein [Spirosoma taeanense]|uniref:Glycosyltransferase family 1 protein n=1 Tax=Spirosoma taeanense TaxID=2735870 RepID=A0A6M5Y382_9BACT|nr:glycosyltransferase family 1 protein [Spirosoma taeanense]QJW89037.1 glycosyltransferase family 1 protein [Spirosoma taeanense]
MNLLNSTYSDSFSQSEPTLRATPQKKQVISVPVNKPVEHLVCFSHLRWNFVYQRPQHLLSRASQHWQIWFIEEPIYGSETRMDCCAVNDRLTVVVPHLPHGTRPDEAIYHQRTMVDQFLAQQNIHEFIAWYYTPMALAFSEHLTPRLTVYDCMDELSAFQGAPPSLLRQEEILLKRADLVFTGGFSLYEAKQSRHESVFAFPSSIDHKHFCQARQSMAEPADLSGIPSPRIGFSGVIDERLNLTLLNELADRRPDWQFVLLGPVVKIDPNTLPRKANIHYLGMKAYDDLPGYFSHWDVAMMPFAINEATRYISPTKTPEYLAAGLPVVSTPIRDVVRTYGEWAQVFITDSAFTFEQAIEKALRSRRLDAWTAVDTYLLGNTWDHTWSAMQRIMQSRLAVVTDQ